MLLLAAIAIVVLLLCCQRQWARYLYVIAKTFRRDIRLIWTLINTIICTYMVQRKNSNVFKEFSKIAKKYPYKNAIIFENEIWTFAMLEKFANKVANYFDKQGYQKGDCVGLILENCPEYVCIWLGLSKLGVITALINTNLVQRPLAHSINIANCKGLIFGSNFADALSNITDALKSPQYYEFNRNNNKCAMSQMNLVDLKSELEKTSAETMSNNLHISGGDVLYYVYTSGTTGLPKAATVSNARYLTFIGFIKGLLPKPTSIISYCPMPLYHSSGTNGSISLTLLEGATTVLRKKFSASNYWKDCAQHKCNVAQYIGEMCRYILAAPYDQDIKHNVKTITGNGLKPNIWKAFVKKFKVAQVLEFYGATEGNANMVNIDNKEGSVGCIPIYLRRIIPIALIKYDEKSGEPIRDAHGRCIRCKTNEAGIVIGKINPRVPCRDFKGYLDKDETNKKILLDVFTPGDRYFNSGDVLISDEFGYYYFKDRMGDTFRWKGENVSTVEVEAIISSGTNLRDSVVYGVEIPGTEGKAGMVALVENNALNLDVLAKHLSENLPSYAVPMFVRVVAALPLTGTFKLQKVDLQKEGFDINIIKDKIYFLSLGKYVEVTTELYNDIINQKIRL